ncbi:MAG: hypothetical protein JRH15_20265, partial [Deltaproteobacteria bacterium]|nr:hypothetical protein [Deltaproteobacteria bacterium]
IDPALLAPDTISDSLNRNDRFPSLTRAVTDLVTSVSTGSRFIFGTCSGLDAGMSPEKVLYMYETADRIFETI